MPCEWDPVKARSNFAKHGVYFVDAATVLEDDLALTIRDPLIDEEERWITMGIDGFRRLLVVVYVWHGENIRLISARRATKSEKKQYGAIR